MSKSAQKILAIVGANGGIGSAIAVLGAQKGYSIAVGYFSNLTKAKALVSKINSAGGTAQCFQVDVSQATSVEIFFDAVIKNMGIPIGFINCAGITGAVNKVTELSTQEIQKIINVNLLGSIYCMQKVTKLMSLSSGGAGGVIINLSSEAGKFGGVNMATYASTKAAINIFTMAMAREVGGDGIRINAISPGVIDTDQHLNISNERLSGLVSSIPIGRIGNPAEVAEAAIWLLSSSASYISGATLSINGGR